MKSLGIDSRTSFLKHDLTKPLKPDVQYDLAVSNLVFHNMEKKRFKAYETVFDALKPKGYFVIAGQPIAARSKTRQNGLSAWCRTSILGRGAGIGWKRFAICRAMFPIMHGASIVCPKRTACC
jgi:hypothetical protein